MKTITENNKDVVALSYLIRDYMRKTHSINFTLADIVNHDSLNRIVKNFSALEVGNWPDPWKGGYAVYFKFAEGRNQNSVKLTANEKIPWKVKEKKEIGRNDGQLAKNFDGEIHFYYPERYYHITGILLRKSRQ